MPTVYQQEVAQNLGNIPFVYYGSYQIDINDISFFSLYYEDGIPYFKISFYDTLNLMKDRGMPLDDSKIKVFLNPRSEQLKEILIQFKIISFNISGNRYNIEGIIDINLLLVPQRKSYPNMTSHKVLQQISREAGVGFNTNISDTNDQMTWINTGSTVKDFMQEITESSYKSDSSFISSFVDFYYNFNMVDIAKELDRNIDNQLGITDRSLSDVVKSITSETITNLLITNDESLRETNLFFESYRIINNSTKISLESRYKNTVQYYDENLKDLLVFEVDSITSKDNKSIILKGSPQDEVFFNLNTNTHYLGKFDSDNCHKNYNYSWVQNEKNLFDLEKICLEVNMRTPNFSIYKFQKIKLFLSNQASTPSTNIENQRLSGDWLVIDIKFTYSNGKFRQTFKLVKRELELSDEELSNEAPINSPKIDSLISNNDVKTNANTIVGVTGSTNVIANNEGAKIEVNSILTKDIWRRIYTGKASPAVIERTYSPVVDTMEKYGMNTKSRISAFISQIDIISLASGTWNNSNWIGSTTEEISNSISVKIQYWLKGSSWGNLNIFADNMEVKNSIDNGVNLLIPNSTKDGKQLGFKVSKEDNFSTSANSSNNNLVNFTLICFGISGGYDGYKDRIDKWNDIRKYFV